MFSMGSRDEDLISVNHGDIDMLAGAWPGTQGDPQPNESYEHPSGTGIVTNKHPQDVAILGVGDPDLLKLNLSTVHLQLTDSISKVNDLLLHIGTLLEHSNSPTAVKATNTHIGSGRSFEMYRTGGQEGNLQAPY